MRICVAKNYQDMSRKAANILSAEIILNPTCVVGLATGSTPVGLYKQLIDWYKKGDLDLSQVRSVNLDEYVGLSPTHVQSYRYFMEKNFFDYVNINPNNIHIPNGLASDLTAECAQYNRVIQELGGIDVQILGMGHNGHIGFNEPGDTFDVGTHVVELKERTIEANSRFFSSKDEVPHKAITMGIGHIMQARRVVMIVSGKEKADIVKTAFEGPVTPRVPASILQIHPNFVLIGDPEALSKLDII